MYYSFFFNFDFWAEYLWVEREQWTLDPITFQFPHNQVLTKRLREGNFLIHRKSFWYLFTAVRSPVKTSASQEILICGRIFCVTAVSSFLFVKKCLIEVKTSVCMWMVKRELNSTALHQQILNVTNLTLGGGSFIGNLWFSHFPISSSNRFGPIPPLQAHPWGILNFGDVWKLATNIFNEFIKYFIEIIIIKFFCWRNSSWLKIPYWWCWKYCIG